jgi:predicted phage terminase large subunit-like protein
MWAGKVDFPDLKQAFYGNWEKWKPHVVLVEDAASGISLVQEMRTLTNIPVTAVKVDKDKKTRVNAVTPMVSSGLVEIPLEASWRHEWENEHESFPSATYDDLVDCTSMFLNWARTNVVEPHPLQEIHQRSKWRR